MDTYGFGVFVGVISSLAGLYLADSVDEFYSLNGQSSRSVLVRRVIPFSLGILGGAVAGSLFFL